VAAPAQLQELLSKSSSSLVQDQSIPKLLAENMILVWVVSMIVNGTFT
jgi:hypothetical protein